MAEICHRFVETNGIRMHVAEAGDGPLVVLCHGFPESWYSWRHQLRALADAGFHAVAPDQRGYGRTDRPEDAGRYTLLHLVGDIVGLVDALGADSAVIVGHDWGAPVAWNGALLRPDRFRAVVGLSGGYTPRGDVRPTEGLKAWFGGRFIHPLYFQEPGKAEAELQAEPRRTIRALLYSVSGSRPRPESPPPRKMKTAGFLDGMEDPAELPPWLTPEDIDVYVGEYERTGFTGGLNWYRCVTTPPRRRGGFSGNA